MPAMGRLGGTALGKAQNPCGNTWVLRSTEVQVLVGQEFSSQLPWECGAQLDVDWDAASVLSRSKAGREGQEHPTGQMVLLLRAGSGSPRVSLGLFNCLTVVCWPSPHHVVSSAILSFVELSQQQWIPGSRESDAWGACQQCWPFPSLEAGSKGRINLN